MPVHFPTDATRKLERFASRYLERSLEIVRCNDNRTGRYFVIAENGNPWRTWKSLGWTYEDAIEAITQMSEG